MRRAALVVLVSIAAAVPAGAKEPSRSCDGGEVPSTATPAGIGVRQSGDPYQDPQNVYVCNARRSAVPHGVVWVRVDHATGRANVIADGDSTSGFVPCADGYLAARADAGGVRLYQAPDGDFAFFARERAPQEVAASLAGSCPPDLGALAAGAAAAPGVGISARPRTAPWSRARPR